MEKLLLLLYIFSMHLPAALAQGTPRPFTQVEQITMLVLHNMRRGALEGQINMECLLMFYELAEESTDQLTTWVRNDCPRKINKRGEFRSLEESSKKKSTTTRTVKLRRLEDEIKLNKFKEDADNSAMIAYAQNQANSCNMTAPADAPYGLAYHRIQSATASGLDEYIAEAAKIKDNNFDYLQNQVNGVDTDSEKNLFRQVYWFEAKQIGCGRALCNNNAETRVVCAYTYKQNNKSLPYIVIPNQQSCLVCKANKPECVNKLCCTLPSTPGAGAGSTTAGSGACGSRPEKMDVMVKIWYPPLSTNYLLTQQSEVYRIAALPLAEYNGPVGSVALEKDTRCPQLVPIHHIYNPVLTTDYYVVDEALYRARLSEGYQDKGTIGYAVRGENVCGATIPIYEFYWAASGHMQLPPGLHATRVFNKHFGPWDWQGVSFWIWTERP